MTNVKDPAKAHGQNGYTNLGCRCEVCRAAWAAYTAKRKTQRILGDPGSRGQTYPQVHNASAYTNWNCRCDVCRADWSRYQKDLYARRKAAS